jgi:hypothetical protein
VGRLNHVAFIILMMRHFMSRLYTTMQSAEKATNCQAFISVDVKHDLKLHKTFLTWAAAGLSMNLITYRTPTIYYRLDACEHGIGGYNICTSLAWRFDLPGTAGSTYI